MPLGAGDNRLRCYDNRKSTSISVNTSTATALPLSKVGRQRHFVTASISGRN
jgi:hypothetical protein